MSYDNPQSMIHNFANMDFGAAAGATTHRICGPAGKKGRLVDIGVALSEATVFATTLGHIQVGTAADADAYGKLNIATGQAINTVYNSSDDTDAIIDADIPADTVVVVTLTEGTGAGLTGQGAPMVAIDWY
jgi:hypothetical protein